MMSGYSDAKIYFKNEYKFQEELKLKTNFNYKRNYESLF